MHYSIAILLYNDKKILKTQAHTLEDITSYLAIDGEIEIRVERVKMTLLVLSFPMIEPFFFFTTIAITGQIMEPANNVMAESWNHASLPLRACAGPLLAVAYVYEGASGNVQGERSSGIS